MFWYDVVVVEFGCDVVLVVEIGGASVVVVVPWNVVLVDVLVDVLVEELVVDDDGGVALGPQNCTSETSGVLP